MRSDPEQRGKDALIKIDEYRVPVAQMIGAGAKKLYAAEERRTAAMKDCAKEWCKLQDLDPESIDDVYKKAMPQVIFDLMDNFDQSAAVLACEEYLKQMGWKVERPVG